VGDPPGHDVLDPANHPSRRLRVRVQVQYEGAAGRQLEHGGFTGRVPPCSWGLSVLCHGATIRPPNVLLYGTPVRLRLEGG